ncbi:MFS transporter [Marinomonas rhizomae]|uniref:Putative MFS family arabinose efflux permease n=1 Tax=Marinomonas rhizomae TaxID=491948 RepID=A0A366JEX4_9GAMM|nr:putative MFS family arabinose efflux permease [Marinomonas rhizomae]RNF74962.1 MFS transporter [Marinomonas rhizomae]
MYSLLLNSTYRHLFLAQIIALLGTGFATIALGLLAFELAGGNAGLILGTALSIKMIAYVFISPIGTSLIRYLPRKQALITLDVIRACVALLLPFVSEVWHIFVLIFLLQATSACFTPLFQATLADILPDEEEYTKALSLSRLAYDLENILSPSIAALILLFTSWQSLFLGTTVGFTFSAILVLQASLPLSDGKTGTPQCGFLDRVTRGIRFYLATPRLRGLLAMNMAVTAAGAMVFINTVVIVQGELGLSEQTTATTMIFFGAGSMVAALASPWLLKKLTERTIMLMAAAILVVGLIAASAIETLMGIMIIWCVLGAGYSFIQTPSGRLLNRSAHKEDKPDLFAAQFSLSHSCWLVAYPLAGYLGATYGIAVTFLIFAGITLASILLALAVWPREKSVNLEHSHNDLPPNHPHLKDEHKTHTHTYIIDALHHHWPK